MTDPHAADGDQSRLDNMPGNLDDVSIRVFGPDVTSGRMEEIGGKLNDLLDAIAESQGEPTGLMRCVGAQIACDSCDARRHFEAAGHGWVRTTDGHDYCPDCIVTSPGLHERNRSTEGDA